MRGKRGQTYISIHAPREGSDAFSWTCFNGLSISIHAPREGSDGQNCPKSRATPNFYPRSPRGERPAAIIKSGSQKQFLSTLPARGATAFVR